MSQTIETNPPKRNSTRLKSWSPVTKTVTPCLCTRRFVSDNSNVSYCYGRCSRACSHSVFAITGVAEASAANHSSTARYTQIEHFVNFGVYILVCSPSNPARLVEHCHCRYQQHCGPHEIYYYPRHLLNKVLKRTEPSFFECRLRA